MKKLNLNLDELKIESFEITKSKQAKGTVNGFLTTYETKYITCVGPICQETDQITCAYVC